MLHRTPVRYILGVFFSPNINTLSKHWFMGLLTSWSTCNFGMSGLERRTVHSVLLQFTQLSE